MESAQRHILVVDDDPDIRDTLADVLSMAGFRVTSAANGREALERLRALHCDLVILDLMMPVMSGWEFREEQLNDPGIADVPVIVVSAARAPAPVRAEGFLAKPFDLDRLLDLAQTLAPSASI